MLRDFKSDYSAEDLCQRQERGWRSWRELLARFLAEDQIYMERVFPYQEAGKDSADPRIRTVALRRVYESTGILVKARVPREIYGISCI